MSSVRRKRLIACGLPRRNRGLGCAGVLSIRNPKTRKEKMNKKLYILFIAVADGDLVQLWTHGGGNNQRWVFQAP
jgi:hypothetical protein